MQTIEDFLIGYFHERVELRKAWLTSSAAFREKFFTTDYSTEHRSSEDAIRPHEAEAPARMLSVQVHDYEASHK